MTAPTKKPPVLAALRDASWLANPDTRSPKRAHVLRADGRAACGLVAVMSNPEPAEDVPDWQRCQRPGCLVKWPPEER